MIDKYLQEMFSDEPDMIKFLRKFRNVIMWDDDKDHREGLLRFDTPPSEDTAFVFKFEDDQLIYMHTLGMKFCIDIYFFDKHGHFINKWMNVPPGNPGNTMEFGTDRDQLNSKTLARYAIEVVNPNCKPREDEDLNESVTNMGKEILNRVKDVNSKVSKDTVSKYSLYAAGAGMAASFIIPYAMKYGEKYLTKAGKACKDKDGPEYNICKSQFHLKALNIQKSKLQQLKSKCKDKNCITKVSLKIDNLNFKIKQKMKQLNYEKEAMRRQKG